MSTLIEPKRTANEASESPKPKRGGRQRLVIVGGGMAAHGLCERLVNLEVAEEFQITIFGAEKHRCYDRVNLSKYFEGQTESDLMLAGDDWYADHGIEFRTGHYISQIDRQTKQIVDSEGNRFEYDNLILATGSRAWVPPIPGHDSPGVFVYRTLDDLKQIKEHVETHDAKVGAVIGGGLLGLESAKVLMDLGLKTAVIEMAPGLMPRQLDASAAARLKEHVESIGVDVHLVRRTESILPNENNGVKIQFSNAEDLEVDILIIAAGVRPNDQLATAAGLDVGSRGGIQVNYKLQTTDPAISAIGECVSFQDHVYGLVAPCYRMADVVARRLAGDDAYFLGADESAELKLLGIPVIVLGRAIGQLSSCVVLSQEDDNAYRKLIMQQGRLAGAACVGDWEQLPMIRHAIAQSQGLWPMQRARFLKTGSPWAISGALPVAQWPATSVICSCLGVTKAELDLEVSKGVEDVHELVEKTRASTACGSCHSLVCDLAGSHSEKPAVAGARTMLVASVAAAVFCAILILAPPINFARSVQDGWRQIDVLWRSDLARQITGFTTLGLIALGLVFSLRKRVSWFRFGSYGFWRSVHGLLGAGVLLAFMVHTGFRLGDNLNFVLAIVFIGTAILGSAAGVYSSLENRATGTRAMAIRRWRPRLTKLHMWLFWPLPALIAIHIITFYWFSD